MHKPTFLLATLFLAGLADRARAEAADPMQQSTLALEVGAARAVGDNGSASVPKLLGYKPLTGRDRWNEYLRDAFWSPGVFFRAAGPALGAQLNNEPAVWGQGTEGYSKRFANRFGRFALQETYQAAGAALLQHEVRYVRSKGSGFWPRAAHALAANFVTYDQAGRRAPHFARVGSVVAAEFTGNLWMPSGYSDASRAMRGVGVELGVSSGFNLMREFAPELKRIFAWR